MSFDAAAIRYDRTCLPGVLARDQKSASFCIFDIQIEQIFDALSALPFASSVPAAGGTES